MSDTIPASEDTSKPKRPAKSFNPNRRITPRQLRKAIARLRRNLRKEERRAVKVKALKDQVNALSHQLQGYRNDPELRSW